MSIGDHPGLIKIASFSAHKPYTFNPSETFCAICGESIAAHGKFAIEAGDTGETGIFPYPLPLYVPTFQMPTQEEEGSNG